MGIRLLNTFLQNKVKNEMQKKNLRVLRGKRIVVDISIYLYRFAATDSIIENMYLMCSLFRYYGIHPLFIFDGKYRREEKSQTLSNRYKQKQRAKNKYLRYENMLNNSDNAVENERIAIKMTELRRTFVKLTTNDIDIVKQLLDAYGMMYREAEGEADGLCAALVIKNAAYACLSEDTDLFAYGCPRVMKYISLINHTFIMYELKDVLQKLNMSFNNFRILCLMSGTDYIINNSDRNIFHNFVLYNSYKDAFPVQPIAESSSFLDWILDNKYLNRLVYQKIKNEIQNYANVGGILSNIEYFLIRNKNVEYYDLKNILRQYNFIFPE